MHAATVVTGVELRLRLARRALSFEVQNRRVPVTFGVRGAAPTTNVSLMLPRLGVPTALKTYPLLPCVPGPAFDSGSGTRQAVVLEGVHGSAPPRFESSGAYPTDG